MLAVFSTSLTNHRVAEQQSGPAPCSLFSVFFAYSGAGTLRLLQLGNLTVAEHLTACLSSLNNTPK